MLYPNLLQVEMMASQVIPTSGMPAAGMPPNMASGMPATGMPPNMASGMPGAGIGGVPPNMGAGTMGGSSVPEQQETKMDQSLPSSRDSMHEMAKPAQATSQSNIQIPNSAGKHLTQYLIHFLDFTTTSSSVQGCMI